MLEFKVIQELKPNTEILEIIKIVSAILIFKEEKNERYFLFRVAKIKTI